MYTRYIFLCVYEYSRVYTYTDTETHRQIYHIYAHHDSTCTEKKNYAHTLTHVQKNAHARY